MKATLSLTNFTAGELSPKLDGRVDLSRYYNGCRLLENFLVHPHGGATRRSGMRFVARAGNPAAASRLAPFEFNAEQAYVLEFWADGSGQGYMRVFKDQGRVLDSETGEPYAIETPYGLDDLDRLRWVQSNDTLILTHPAHAPRKLTRADHDDWTLTEIEFTGRPEGWTEGDWPCLSCFFEERLVFAATPTKPNTLWFSRSGDYFDFRLNTREVPLEDWDELEVADANADNKRDGKAGDTFTLLDGLTFESGSVVKGESPDGDKRWYRYQGGVCVQTAGADKSVTFAAEPGNDQVEPVLDAEGALDAENWEALALGDRIADPTGESPLDDDGIEITLSAAQANAVEFLVPRNRLWVGTIGGEWTVGGASTGEPISPASVKASQEGTAGAARAMAARASHVGLYIQRAGRKVREMAYRYEADSYVSRDLTLLSEHITAPGLTDLVYVQEPDSIVFCLRSDGALVSLTYEPDQEVYAWARQVTDGAVASLASIYNGPGQRDELWLVVRRRVGGQEVHYVEFLEAGFDGDLASGFFVDSGLTYRGDPVGVVTGLDHLAGREVAVLADGAVHRNLTVAPDGSIALDRTASVVSAGLPYLSSLAPLRLEGATRQATDQTKIKRIIQVAARFHQTLGGRIGPAGGELEPVFYRTSAHTMGSAPALFSGDRIVKFPKGWEREAVVSIVQDQPLPMTVLMLVPQVVVNQ